jgi:hypothetical protein
VRALERVYDSILTMLQEVAQVKPGFEIIVTAMDSYSAPRLREYIGVDMKSVRALQQRFNFRLQVEDPEDLWSTDPRRYIAIGDHYGQLLGGKDRLLLDLNILSFRKAEKTTPFPTLIQTGTESYLLVQAASLGAPRMTIYSESSINPQDMRFLPYALATGVRYRSVDGGYTISTPTSVVMNLPPETKEIRLDGNPLSPSRDNLYLIPAVTHTVRLGSDPSGAFSPHALDARILSFTGNILAVTTWMRSIEVVYESHTRTLISINREPVAVNVDGEEYSFTSMRGNDCFSLFLPAGSHTVKIVAGDAFSYGVNLTSFWYTTVVALFGLLAVLSLAGMYLALKIHQRREHARGGDRLLAADARSGIGYEGTSRYPHQTRA